MELGHLSKEPSHVRQPQEKKIREVSSEPKPDDGDTPNPHFNFDKEDDFAYGQLDFRYDGDFSVPENMPR